MEYPLGAGLSCPEFAYGLIAPAGASRSGGRGPSPTATADSLEFLGYQPLCRGWRTAGHSNLADFLKLTNNGHRWITRAREIEHNTKD